MQSAIQHNPASSPSGGVFDVYLSLFQPANLAHMRLDEAVFAAYVWNSELSDEEILEKLLSLNLERAEG